VIVLLLLIIVVLIITVYYKSMAARGERLCEIVYAAALKAHITNKIVEVPNANVWSAIRFFDVHASTANKYTSLPGQPGYAGYARLGEEEVIVIAVRHSKGLSVTTHELPYQFGNDLISLTAKAQFFDEVMNIYSRLQKEH